MNCVIYVRPYNDIPIYYQHNVCTQFARRNVISIVDRILDFEGNSFHKAINKVVADYATTTLIIYSKDAVFPNNDDFLFYRIYLEKLNKKLIMVN